MLVHAYVLSCLEDWDKRIAWTWEPERNSIPPPKNCSLVCFSKNSFYLICIYPFKQIVWFCLFELYYILNLYPSTIVTFCQALWCIIHFLLHSITLREYATVYCICLFCICLFLLVDIWGLCSYSSHSQMLHWRWDKTHPNVQVFIHSRSGIVSHGVLGKITVFQSGCTNLHYSSRRRLLLLLCNVAIAWYWQTF